MWRRGMAAAGTAHSAEDRSATCSACFPVQLQGRTTQTHPELATDGQTGKAEHDEDVNHIQETRTR